VNVGFIGLGSMGLLMTRNLLAAGHTVTVASRSQGPVDAAVASGAIDGRDPAGVVAASEITLLCVPDSPDVVAVIDALLPALQPGKIVVDCSTISPDVERAQHDRVNAAGASYLEAPLSGGTVGAEKGTLTLMVGGAPEVLERARPAFESVGALIAHCGGPGMGQTVKLCNNLLYAAQMVATAEATALAEKAGVDIATLHLVLMHSTGGCPAVRDRIPVAGIVPDGPPSNGWKPGFMTDLMLKDVSLALAAARTAGVPMPSTAISQQVLSAASVAGYGREDFSALAKVVRTLSGLDVT
jgi:3-hydroxyisobutyrate dehydrogenase